jgi:tRNA threonylcarbamoyladenosine biosynthesis protein TsaB
MINSNENNAFAAVFMNNGFHVSRASEFNTDKSPVRAGRSPDKLINCLAALREKFDFRRLDAVSVTTGPGSFTGIRVGLAFAKGIAAAINKLIIPINNFDLSLFRIQDKSSQSSYCVLIPAKLPEYYFAVYENMVQTKSGSGTIEEITESCSEKIILVSNFEDETIKKLHYFKSLNLNSSSLGEEEALLVLSQKYFLENRQVLPEHAEPVYIKEFNLKI